MVLREGESECVGGWRAQSCSVPDGEQNRDGHKQTHVRMSVEEENRSNQNLI